MYNVEKEVPCFVFDDEGEVIFMGLLTGIKRIDSIDYHLYYDYGIEIWRDEIEFKKDFKTIQSYNHLESMEFGDNARYRAIKYMFGEEI